nr:hypothetical protein [uncultured Chryseobacterium sp.]
MTNDNHKVKYPKDVYIWSDETLYTKGVADKLRMKKIKTVLS